MKQTVNDFDELGLMINVMLEDSLWLDSHQSKVLNQCSEADCKEIPAITMKVENSCHGQQQLSRKRDQSSLLSDPPLKESAQESSIPDIPVMKRARSNIISPHLSESLTKQLPAPEFVIANRSSVATETLRLARSALSFSEINSCLHLISNSKRVNDHE